MDDPFQFNTNNSLSPGQVFLERYTLIKFIGRGGMGQVWLVKDLLLGEDIALKFLPSEIMADRAGMEDLKRETLRSRKLSHPNIIKVYDFATAHNSGAISMEYVAGGTLADVRYDMPGMVMDATDSRFTTWMIQLAEALAYAHETVGIVHRDLKPQNLMLDAQGNLKLADFGVSRSLTDSMSRLSRQNAGSSGTHIYMSPQQAQGMAPSASDDIYAFGATLYDLLTGKPPFFRGNIQHQIDNMEPDPMNQRRAELVEDVELPAIPQNWEDLIAACLKKHPSERPASMREIGDYLLSGSQQPIKAGPPPISERDLTAAENARLVGEARLRNEAERQERELQETERQERESAEANRRRVGDSASSVQETVAEHAAAAPAVTKRKKSSPLPWIIAACVVLGLVAWGLVSSNKPPQTRTVTVTDNAAVQRERDKAEAATSQVREAEQRAAKAEQEKQALAAQTKAKEDAAKQAAERQRQADLAEKERLAFIAQTKAMKDTANQAAERQRQADLAEKERLARTNDEAKQAESAKAAGASLKAIKIIEATKDNPFINSLGMKFVPVLIAGGPTDGQKVFFSIWETRNQDFSKYIKDKALARLDRAVYSPAHPVSSSWDEAKAFCEWLTIKERSSGVIGALDEYRLPSDHEWSCAAGIGAQEKASDSPTAKDSKITGVFPWGNEWPPPKGTGNFHEFKAKNGEIFSDGYILDSPVGLFSPNGLGIYDLAGNQWEWCEDWFDPAKKDLRVLRGGSSCNNDSLRLGSSFRNRDRPSTLDEVIYGFRCVIVVSDP